MKNVIILILLAATIALGALWGSERTKLQTQAVQLKEAESRIAAVESQLRGKSQLIENASLADAKAKVLQKTLTETAAAAVEKSKKVEQLEQTLADSKSNNPASLMASMFKDPKMKDMIKSQQKAVFGPMIDKNYSPLFQQLHLAPEQSAHVRELIEQKMLAAADGGMSMMDGSMDSAKRADLAKQIKEQTEAIDAQIKDYLGSDNQAAYEKYESSMPERMSIGQFRDQLAGAAAPLTAAQEEQLIQAMHEERTRFKWTTDYADQKAGDMNFAEMFSDEHLKTFANEKNQFDQQFLTRAAEVLTPDQLKTFTDFQTSQRDLQINGMKLAAQMFGTKKVTSAGSRKIKPTQGEVGQW